MKVNTIPKGQNCNRCLYYRHSHCATQYGMFRKYFDSQSQSKHICEEFKFVHESVMTLRYLYGGHVHINDISALKHAYKHGEPE